MSRGRRRGVWVALVCLGASAPAPLDRVVLAVDREAITASQLLTEMRVALLLRAGPCAARRVRLPRPLSPQAPASDAATELLAHQLEDYVIDQRLVAAEVRRQGAAGATDEELAYRLTTVQNRFADPVAYEKFLQEFGIAPVALEEIVRREIEGEQFIRSRLAPRVAAGGALELPADPQDGGSAPDSERQPADPQPDAALPASALRPGVLRDWLRQLRGHAEIRQLGATGRLERLPSSSALERLP